MTFEKTLKFNAECSCSTINRTKLSEIQEKIKLSGGISSFELQKYFAPSPTSISKNSLEKIKKFIEVISSILGNSAMIESFLQDMETRFKHSVPLKISGGLFLGFDFHETETGPKLIEINTNAGGLLINSILYEVQENCCNLLYSNQEISSFSDLGNQINKFVEKEWSFQIPDRKLETIVVLDENPESQFLFPEFEMFQNIMIQHGKKTLICSPLDLRYENNGLYFRDQRIDFVYNRHTDFLLKSKEMQGLAEAFASKQIALSPNPVDYLIYANKLNLQKLSDKSFLLSRGISEKEIQIIQDVIPETKVVNSKDSNSLWENRKTVFFKPQNSYGSKGVYAGRKLTKSKFEEILNLDYITQTEIPPSKRTINLVEFKIDYRAYVYNSDLLMLTSRLYQGQATNFRTEGGGFSPVLECGGF